MGRLFLRSLMDPNISSSKREGGRGKQGELRYINNATQDTDDWCSQMTMPQCYNVTR